jgi:hypothetical protein
MFSFCSFASDMYSFCMVLYEITIRKPPYHEVPNNLLKDIVVNDKRPELIFDESFFTEFSTDFIRQGTSSEVGKRPKHYKEFLGTI